MATTTWEKITIKVKYYTRDRYKLGSYGGDKRVMTRLSVSNQVEDGDSRTAAISWRNNINTGRGNNGVADMNRDASGDDIYIHQHFTEQTLQWKERPTFASDLTFDGNAQELVTKDTWDKNYGTLYYRVNNGSWSSRFFLTATNRPPSTRSSSTATSRSTAG